MLNLAICFIIINLLIGLVNVILIQVIKPFVMKDLLEQPEHFSKEAKEELSYKGDTTIIERFKEEFMAYILMSVPIYNLYILSRLLTALINCLYIKD